MFIPGWGCWVIETRLESGDGDCIVERNEVAAEQGIYNSECGDTRSSTLVLQLSSPHHLGTADKYLIRQGSRA